MALYQWALGYYKVNCPSFVGPSQNEPCGFVVIAVRIPGRGRSRACRRLSGRPKGATLLAIDALDGGVAEAVTTLRRLRTA